MVLSPVEWAFVGALAILIFVYPRLRKRSVAAGRAAVLQGMGFVEVPAFRVFEQPRVLAALIFDRRVASISSWTGVGRSAIGDTVVFDFTHDFDGARGACTVVGFRVPAALPDFEVRHTLLLERALKVSNEGDVQPPATLARFNRSTHAWVGPDLAIPVLHHVDIGGPPAFANNYRVWAADAASVRRVLTPVVIDALAAEGDGNLHLLKRLEWLLILRWTSRVTPPAQYPALVQAAVALAEGLDLRPPSGSRSTASTPS